ncbi:MAG: hypothetical protein ACYTG7_10550 [Planctomycetota bacterium]
MTLIALFALPVLGMSVTINVPADYESIQEAIDAADSGDTVLVASGTYFEHIDFKGKAITVMSADGPEVTVIDGVQTETVVQFISGEDPGSVLKGFTITNGLGTSNGGGIICNNTSPVILGNVISKNTAVHGGGIFCRDLASPLITNNVILENTATATSGGGGGGIGLLNSSPEISNNIIAMNTTTYGGGGIGGYSASFTMVNNTLFGNSAAMGGGGLAITQGSIADVANTIFWENDASFGPEIRISTSTNPSTLNIGYSNVEGGKSLVSIESGCTLNWGTGMIADRPLFVDAAEGDFHLTFESPCMDSGNNELPLPDEDFEGDPRIAYQEVVDMGADECYTHLYVTGNKTPGGTIAGKFIGAPGTTPVGLFIGSDVLPSPQSTMWGEFHLLWPYILLGPLGTIPADGVMVISTTLPMTPAAPYSVPMQALIGLNPDSLSNLFVLEVR